MIRSKLATHWTSIFRHILSKYDKSGSGTITALQFEECLHNIAQDLYFSKDDLAIIYKHFGKGLPENAASPERASCITLDYLEMGNALGLDSNKIHCMVQQKTNKGINLGAFLRTSISRNKIAKLITEESKRIDEADRRERSGERPMIRSSFKLKGGIPQ